MLQACGLLIFRKSAILRYEFHLGLVSNNCFVPKRNKNYSRTVNLPKTDFPLSLDSSIYEREIGIQKECQFGKLYQWQSNQSRTSEFILHDGPPYANGSPHVGHALNKILKDIINRYKLLRGYKIHYVPGWDCHGMPIEQKALKSIADSHQLDPLEIRRLAREFAVQASHKQKEEFKNWGIMADWDGGCYYTFDPKYEANQLEAFFVLHEKGLIYRRFMPVFWSPTSRSALAEAELEYKEDHESDQVYAKFSFLKHPPHWSMHGKFNNLYAVIWTTTPWTLPLNRLICYSKEMRYCLLKDPSTNDGYVVSENFKDDFSAILGRDLIKVLDFLGSELLSSTYLSTNDREAPFLPSNHVTIGKGTGLVHCAPAHGVEDFQVALKNKISVDCHVDEEGKYDQTLGGLSGKFVLTDGTEEVLRLMSHAIIHQSKIKHSYPMDWRTKHPVLCRASLQWFFDTEKIKKCARESLKKVTVYPSSSSKGMESQLEERNYWCISRQRSWGVPIPVFVDKHTKKTLLTRHSIDHLKNLFHVHGSDCWWRMSVDELLPRSVVEMSGFDYKSTSFERGKDTFDIWFDSGTSWFNTLEGNVADVYLEGKDQYGGWFNSSIQTSVAIQEKAPFKTLIVHGFTLDQMGRKMSKSLGNVMDPTVITKGSQDRPGYGIDTLRLWVSLAGLDVGVVISDSLLDDCREKLFKFRKSLRFLMGCLHDFKTEVAKLDGDKLRRLHTNDRYMLHLLYNINNQVASSYDEFKISRVAQLLDKFVASEVSAFYIHSVKDRVYCGGQEERLSSQVAMFHILSVLTRLLAPITPHMCEEVYLYHPLNSVHDGLFRTCHWPEDNWLDADLSSVYDAVWPVRDAVHKMLRTPSSFELNIFADKFLKEKLEILHDNTNHRSFPSPLVELLQVAHVNLEPQTSSLDERGIYKLHKGEGFTVTAKKATGGKCPRCRRNVADTDHELCRRCSDALRF